MHTLWRAACATSIPPCWAVWVPQLADPQGATPRTPALSFYEPGACHVLAAALLPQCDGSQTMSRLELHQPLRLVVFNTGSFGQTPSHRVLCVWSRHAVCACIHSWTVGFLPGLGHKSTPAMSFRILGDLYSGNGILLCCDTN